MKITEYPAFSGTFSNEETVIDGTSGTKKIRMDELLRMLYNSAPVATRLTFRGDNNLGSSITTAQRNEISNGTFRNMFIGDYWSVSGTKWRIVDFDYFAQWNGNKHHAILMPEKTFGKTVWKDTNTIEGGYGNSNLRSMVVGSVRQAIPAGIKNMQTLIKIPVSSGWSDDWGPTYEFGINADTFAPTIDMLYGIEMYHPKSNAGLGSANSPFQHKFRYFQQVNPLDACPTNDGDYVWTASAVHGAYAGCLAIGTGPTVYQANNQYGIWPFVVVG